MSDETEKPLRARRPRAGTAERRAEILRAAMHTFGSKGYHNGSLNEVAEQVGITHAGVLHHFGSKDKLLTKVLEYRDEVDVAHLENRHIPGGLNLFRHLVQTAARNVGRRGIVQAYTVLTGESVTDGHPASDWVTTRFTVLREEIAQALREVVGEHAPPEHVPAESVAPPEPAPDGGTERPGDDTFLLAASAIIGVMDGLQVQWLLDPDAVELPEATAFAIEAIVSSAIAGARRPRPLA